jgi:hypothetical protein
LSQDSVVDFQENMQQHSSIGYNSKVRRPGQRLRLCAVQHEPSSRASAALIPQFWKRGVEEAEELVARRAGLEPPTQYDPIDFAERKRTPFANLARQWAVAQAPASARPKSAGSGAAGARLCPLEPGQLRT